MQFAVYLPDLKALDINDISPSQCKKKIIKQGKKITAMVLIRSDLSFLTFIHYYCIYERMTIQQNAKYAACKRNRNQTRIPINILSILLSGCLIS